MYPAFVETGIELSFIENVFAWRSATKTFSARHVQDDKLEVLIQTLRMSPPSINI